MLPRRCASASTTSCRSRTVAASGVGPVEVGAVPGQQGGGDEDRRGVGRRRPGEDLVGGAGVAADEAVEEGGLVIGHRTTVA